MWVKIQDPEHKNKNKVARQNIYPPPRMTTGLDIWAGVVELVTQVLYPALILVGATVVSFCYAGKL